MKEFNFIKKQSRHFLAKILVNDQGLIGTDLETYLLVKNKGNIKNGLYNVDLINHGIKSDLNVDNFPLIDFKTNKKDEIVTFDIKDIKSLLKHASKDKTRLHLNGMFIGNGLAICTDGYTMKLISCSRTKREYIIPRTSLAILLTLIKKGNVVFSLSEDFAIVDTDNYSIKMRLIKRDFPKYQSLFPASFKYSLQINNWPGLKEIKPLLSSKTMLVKIETIKGNIILTCPIYNNTYIIGKCDKKFQLKIGFNASLIQRTLDSNKKKDFTLKTNKELKPCEINECLAMPLKL